LGQNKFKIQEQWYTVSDPESKHTAGSFSVNSTRGPQLKSLILLIFFSEDRQTFIVMKDKILNFMNVYLLGFR